MEEPSGDGNIVYLDNIYINIIFLVLQDVTVGGDQVKDTGDLSVWFTFYFLQLHVNLHLSQSKGFNFLKNTHNHEKKSFDLRKNSLDDIVGTKVITGG